jgi:hypothetical protein
MPRTECAGLNQRGVRIYMGELFQPPAGGISSLVLVFDA